MRVIRLYFGLIFWVLGTLALAGCGGGGGGSSTVPGATTTIQGSVPGTVFVAVDDNTNLEAGRVTATGTGTPKTFSMVVPTGMSYRFYVMENEGTGNSRVYPIFMGTNNVFELDNTANGQMIALGVINPDMVTGKATPANNPALMMGRGANGAVPPTLAGSAFSMDNVKGTTWGYNTMMTSGTMGWEHGTLSFDGNGLGSMTGIVRNGSTVASRINIPFTMSLSGMLLNPGDNTFQCVVSKDMTVMIATFTDSTGGPAMMIGQKRGGVYQAGGLDMNGTWRFQRLTAGSDNTSSGWAFGTMGITSGSATITSMTTNIGVGGGGTSVFSMDASGIMTEAADTSFYGVMSFDKSMIVATDTSGGRPEIWVMMRSTLGTTYSTADMAGAWVMHSVSSGNAVSRDWAFGHSVGDSGGNNTFSQMMGSTGAIPPTQMTMVMNIATGAMTMPGTGGGMGGGMMGGGMMTSTFHGIMNEAKNMMVSTYTDGGVGGYPFSMQLK
jgi:hypothetical protein